MTSESCAHGFLARFQDAKETEVKAFPVGLEPAGKLRRIRSISWGRK